jgi:hypothetical protein
MAQETTPGGQQPPKPHLHIDDDWKRQAQEEKERLAREVAAKSAKPAAPPPGAPQPPRGQAFEAAAQATANPDEMIELPQASFAELVRTLATQAAIFMSGQVDPETGEPVQNLDLAKHNIDLLRVLEEKTKGNLTDDEKRLLDTLQYELLNAYVSAAS